MLDPRIVGEEHYKVATDVQKTLQSYKSLQDIIAILGMDELSEEDKVRKDGNIGIEEGTCANVIDFVSVLLAHCR